MGTVTWGHLGIIVSIFAQTAGIFYWAGVVARTLRDHERRLTALEGGK